jgi:hypothetical protein
MSDGTYTDFATLTPPSLAELERITNALPRPAWTHAVESPTRPGTLQFLSWPASNDPELAPDYPHGSVVCSAETANQLRAAVPQRWGDNQSLFAGMPIFAVSPPELRRWSQVCSAVHLTTTGPWATAMTAEKLHSIRKYLENQS